MENAKRWIYYCSLQKCILKRERLKVELAVAKGKKQFDKRATKKIEIGIVIKQDISENQAKNIFLGIGSNLGNRIINIEKAKSLLLVNGINFISVSNYYETPSWPDPKKPKFINIVLKATCKHKPQE